MTKNINIGTVLYLPDKNRYWLCIDAISVGQGNDPEWKTVKLIGYLGSTETTESEEISNFTICRNINGEIKNIPSENLVPGDIIILKSGDLITADARIIKSSNFYVEE